MITVALDGRSAVVTERELVTSGSYGIQCQFSFTGDDWQSAYAKVAVFRSGDDGTVVDVPIVDPYICTIPYEVMKEAGEVLFIGVYGTDGIGNIIVPTVWASSGVVKQGVVPASATAEPPTVSEWDTLNAIATEANMTADAAMTKAEEAVAIAGGAEAQAERAKGYAESAAGSASDAEGFKETAQEQAGLAEGFAGDAETAAGQASTSAETASQAAEDASGYAEAAGNSVVFAQGYAEVAEGFAKGTKDGEPNPSYAQSNAAYYATQAQNAKIAIESMTATATARPEGSNPTVTKTTDPETGYVNLEFGIPKGDQGTAASFFEIEVAPACFVYNPNRTASNNVELSTYHIVGGTRTFFIPYSYVLTFTYDNGQTSTSTKQGPFNPDGICRFPFLPSTTGKVKIEMIPQSGAPAYATEVIPIVSAGVDGAPGEGVPTGGTTGQYLRKESSTDYDADWDTLTAGDVTYSDEGYYSSGTVGHKLQSLDSEDVDYSYGGDKESGTVGEALDDLVYSDQLHEEKVRGDLLEKFANLPEEDWQYDPCVTAYWDMELHNQKLMWVAVVTVTNLSYPAYVMLWEAEEFGPVPGLLKPDILDYGVTYKFNVESENSAVSTYVVKNGTGSSSGTFVLQEDDSIGIGFKITPTGTMTDTFKVYVEMYDPKTIADLDETVHELQSKDSMIEYDITALYDDVDDVKNTLNHKADAIYDTASGDIASFPDGADGLPVKDLTVGIEPVQDLHGQANPYPPGGGKNLCPHILTQSSATAYGYVANLQSDGTAVVTGTWTGTGNSVIGYQYATEFKLAQGNYILNGTGSADIYHAYGIRLQIIDVDDSGAVIGYDEGNGFSFTLNSEKTVAVRLHVDNTYASGKSFPSGGVIYKPMIRLASVSDPTFAPYSNICPISGWTGCNVTRTGKNLVDDTQKLPGYLKDDGTTGGASAEGNWHTALKPIKGGVKYYVHYDVAYNNILRECFYDKNGTFISFAEHPTNALVSSFTAPENARQISISSRTGVDTHAWLTLGENDLYTPYVGTTIPITFPSGTTVYGGWIDIITGQGEITHKKIDLGNLTFGHNDKDNFRYFWSTGLSSGANKKANGALNIICSQYTTRSGIPSTSNSHDLSISGESNSGNIFIRDDRYAEYTDSQFKEAMNGVESCYELATHIPISLTPTEVKTLLGQNNVWADCGPVSVEYPCDTKLYIDKKLAALVAALS